MSRKILAAILSLALALPVMTGPAQADKKDALKVLGGLAALYILKEALEHERDRGHATVSTREPIYRPRHETYHEPQRSHAPVVAPRPAPRPDRYVPPTDRYTAQQPDRSLGRPPEVRLLPARCFASHDTTVGTVSGYGANCMQNSVARPGILPPQCLDRVDTFRGPRTISRPRCLEQDGWSPRTARR